MENVLKKIEEFEGEMVKTLSELITIPAISPDYGGQGEYDKAMKLLELLNKWDFDEIKCYDAPDERAKNGIRPNIFAYYYGKNRQDRLWIITHLDIVPPGKGWTITEPFKPLVKDGKIYGRGSEDNGQSLVSSLYAVKALMDLGIRPQRTTILAFVSDEETGSNYGLKWLLENHPNLFRKDDLILVPDAGNSNGSFIEIAEKNRLTFKVKIIGKQTHAMNPEKGVNAHLVGMRFAVTLHDMLYKKYSHKNELFEPPISTFEPTKKEKNVDAVNVIPGDDVTYFDCRILPEYELDEILSDIKNTASEFETKYNAKIKIDILRKSSSLPTSPDAKIVRMLVTALRKVRGIEPKIGGIGGGTFAAFLRNKKLPVAVWCTCDETAHQADEYARISNMVEDAKIMAILTMLEE